MSKAGKQLVKVAMGIISQGDTAILYIGDHKVAMKSIMMGEDDFDEIATGFTERDEEFNFDPAALVAVKSSEGLV